MVLIGPHLQGLSDAAARWAKAAPIVKVIDDPAALTVAPDSALRIFRPYVGDNNRNVAEVLAAVDSRLGNYRHPLLYVEPLNEPLPWELDATIAAFALLTPQLHRRDLKVAGPSWSVGNPEPDAFQRWVNFARSAGVDLLTLHAYWADKGFTPWAAGRPLRLVTDSGFSGNWAITEGGRDDLSTPAFNEGGKGGWQRDGVSAEQYVRELLDFTALNATHPRFRGFTPFTAAPTDPKWFPYSTDGLVDLILANRSAPGNGGAIVPTTPDQATIRRKYNLDSTVHETPEIAVAFGEAPTGQVAFDAYGPADLLVSVHTDDGQNRSEGMGHAGVVFARSSDYFPEAGQHGPWVAECGGARVDGLGMKPDHSHPVVRFLRRTQPDPPGPVIPLPASGGVTWKGAFADHAAAHGEVGQPVGEIAYAPEPGAWRCAIQVSASHVLAWNGVRVVQIERDK